VRPSNKHRREVAPESHSLEEFQQRVCVVVDTVLWALHEAKFVPFTYSVTTEAPAACAGDTIVCTCTAILDREHQHLAEQFKKLAEEAVHAQIHRSCGVCLVGSKGTPFRQDPAATGFTAELGSAVVKQHACRKFFEGGLCVHGRECRRLHPRFMTTFRFNIAIDKEELGQPRQGVSI